MKIEVEVENNEKFMHRLVATIDGSIVCGEWASYAGVACLSVGGADYFAVTDYYDGVFATNVPLKVSFP